MVFLIGGRGFVGSAYARLFEARGVPFRIITRENHADYVGQRCDVVVNANGNSKKFMSDRDPKWDFDESVRSVLASIEDFSCSRYILLSTGDVYHNQNSAAATREDGSIDPSKQSRYGFHKYLAEQIVSRLGPHSLIVRMGGFIGEGLKKNAIFDMLNDAPVWLSPASELQFISIDRAAELVWALCEAGFGGEIVNLGARGVVRIGDVHRRLGSASTFSPDAKTIRFELSLDRLERLLPGQVPTSAEEVEGYFGSLGR